MTLRGRPLYLDMQATTPLDPRVLDAMLPFSPSGTRSALENAHVRMGDRGRDRKGAGELAALIGANPKEIVFTSGRRSRITWR